MKPLKKVLVILGPNASGKSSLAIKIAKERNGEIISADSRQVYRGMDIGSGKIMPREMKGVPHHLLDVASPNKIFSASDYALLARRAIDNIHARGKLPIVCGGTGFYIDAALYDGSFALVPPDYQIRKKLDKLSITELAEKLSGLDPERFFSIDRKNRARLVRALEIILSSGKPVPKMKKRPLYDTEKIGILWSTEEISKRIEDRLDKRLKDGMIEEIANLKFPKAGKGLTWKRLYDFGLEYRYVSLYLRGKLTYNEMREQLLTAIKQYAKRQMTWFKRDKSIKWVKI